MSTICYIVVILLSYCRHIIAIFLLYCFCVLVTLLIYSCYIAVAFHSIVLLYRVRLFTCFDKYDNYSRTKTKTYIFHNFIRLNMLKKLMTICNELFYYISYHNLIYIILYYIILYYIILYYTYDTISYQHYMIYCTSQHHN